MKSVPEIARIRPLNARAVPLGIDLLVLAGFCAFLFFFGLDSIGLVGADEPRYAQIAREMLARHDWITPVLQGKPWLEKPVLYYWEAMLSYRIFGVSDWAARLPAAIDATALVAAVYWFMRRFSRGAELDAALITASAALLLGFGHAASTDMPLSASFTISLLAWIAWRLDPRRVWLLVFYLFLALGTLAKGPVAPFLAVLIIFCLALLRRQGRVILRSLWWGGVLLYVAVAAPWYVLVQLRTGNFLHVFVFEHNLERFGTPVFHHTQPFWFFLPIMLLALAPWTVPAIAGFVHAIRRWRTCIDPATGQQPLTGAEADLNLLLALWGVVPVIFFSFSDSKLPGYILPSVPPFAMLAALWLRRKITSERANRALLLLHALAAGALLSLVLLSPYLLLALEPSRQAIAVATAAGLIIFCAVMFVVRSLRFGTLRFVTLLPVILSLAFLLRVAAPVLDRRFSARPVARDVLRLEPAKAPVAVFDVDRELEYGLGFYLDQPIARYERGEVLAGDHLLVSRTGLDGLLAGRLPNRRFTLLGTFPGEHVQLYWVTAK